MLVLGVEEVVTADVLDQLQYGKVLEKLLILAFLKFTREDNIKELN